MNARTLTVIFEWRCSGCHTIEHETIDVVYDPLRGFAAAESPKLKLPDGWKLAGGDAYCSRHEVRPWHRVVNLYKREPGFLGPLPGPVRDDPEAA